MASTLNPVLSERRKYPFAVGVRLAGESKPTYTHFRTAGGAHAWADLFDGIEGNEVTRWVAITEPEYLLTAAVHGWRQVIHFLPYIQLAEE